MSDPLSDTQSWLEETFDTAANSALFAVVGFIILAVVYAVMWVFMGSTLHPWFEKLGVLEPLAHVRREYFSCIPELWQQFEGGRAYRMEAGDMFVLWVLVILGIACTGLIGGACYTVKADPDQHAEFVLIVKSHAMDTHAEDGAGMFLTNAFSQGPVSSVLVILFALRNFLQPYVTGYATPYFFIVNLVNGAVVMSIITTLIGFVGGYTIPYSISGLIFGAPKGDDPATLLLIITFTLLAGPFALMGFIGLAAGVRNSYWLGVGVALWLGSFFPTRWKARRAYRLSAREMRRYIGADGTALPINADFTPKRSDEIVWIGGGMDADGTILPGPLGPEKYVVGIHDGDALTLLGWDGEWHSIHDLGYQLPVAKEFIRLSSAEQAATEHGAEVFEVLDDYREVALQRVTPYAATPGETIVPSALIYKTPND